MMILLNLFISRRFINTSFYYNNIFIRAVSKEFFLTRRIYAPIYAKTSNLNSKKDV